MSNNNMLFFFLTPEAIAVIIPIVCIGYIIWAFIWGSTVHKVVIASILLLGTIGLLLYYIYKSNKSTTGAQPNISYSPRKSPRRR